MQAQTVSLRTAEFGVTTHPRRGNF